MTYASSGVPPLVEEFVQLVYLPNGNMLMQLDGIFREFVLSTKVREMNKRGIDIYKNDSLPREASVRIKALEVDLRNAINKFLDKRDIAWIDLEILFLAAQAFFAQYSSFDSWYTDGAFSYISDPNVAKALDIALIEKNVIRENLTDIFFTPGKNFTQALAHAGAQKGISVDDMHWYFIDELQRAFNGGELVLPEQLKRRRHAFVSYKDENGVFERIEGEEAEKYIRQFDSAAVIDDELKGISAASKGIVRGTVRVIASNYIDFSKTKVAMDVMQEGEILVSPTTAPDLMPALRKASAILTDVGGMLSHAAITAREMSIPCIVGMRNVSSVLKDGDMVEVDADKGIVRKI
jgi:phosphohistidine swiveling domain-containing protein